MDFMTCLHHAGGEVDDDNEEQRGKTVVRWPSGAPKSGPVVTCHNTILYRSGSWSAPSCLFKFRSAVQMLHAGLYPSILSGAYMEICSACVQSPINGCVYHRGHASLVSRGNPLTFGLVDQKMKAVRQMHEKHHTAKATIQLQPREVRILCQEFLSSAASANRMEALEGLKMYVSMLLGISMFLRADELLGLKVDQFIPEMVEVDPEGVGVDYCGFKVMGKSDHEWVYLALYMNEDCPDLCPVRHLLIYIYMSGIKSGYLFPPPGVLPDAEGHVGTAYTYNAYLKNLTNTCLAKCARLKNGTGKNRKVSTHMLRKTGYLFANWGILKRQCEVYEAGPHAKTDSVYSVNMALIMDAACHKCLNNTVLYAYDAMCLYEFARWEKRGRGQVIMDANDVGRWISNRCQNPSDAAAVTYRSRAYQTDLPRLASYFFNDFLQLRDDSYMTISAALETALVRRYSQASAMDELLQKLRGFVPEHIFSQLTPLIDRLVKETCLLHVEPPSDPRLGTDEHVPQATGPSTSSIPPGKKPKRVHGSKDLSIRLDILKLSTLEARLEVMKRCRAQYSTTSELTGKAKSWVYDYLNPTLKCLSDCFAGDEQTFLKTATHSYLIPHPLPCLSCCQRRQRRGRRMTKS